MSISPSQEIRPDNISVLLWYCENALIGKCMIRRPTAKDGKCSFSVIHYRQETGPSLVVVVVMMLVFVAAKLWLWRGAITSCY